MHCSLRLADFVAVLASQDYIFKFLALRDVIGNTM